MTYRNLRTLTLVVGALILLGCFLFWLQQDEAPLDYSRLTVEIGPEDPEVNGYTRIRQFSETFEPVGFDDFDFYDQPAGPPDAEQLSKMQELIEANAALLDAFGDAFQQDLFLADQPARPETPLHEISRIRYYVRLRIFEAHIAQAEGDQEAAMTILLRSGNDAHRYAMAQGPLISLLMSCAFAGIIENELFELLAVGTIQKETLTSAASSYTLPEVWPSAIRAAFQQEFWFAAYCVDLIQENPEEIPALLEHTGQSPRLARTFFKPNRTKNTIFRAYAEIAEQADQPQSKQNHSFGSSLVNRMEREGFGRWLSRNLVGDLLIAILLPSTEKVLERVVERQTGGQALRLAFALKAYHQETGELPDDLDTLMPQYIDAIPLDPYDRQPMRYSKDRAIIYSVGNDFIDHGGSRLPFAFTLDRDDCDKNVAERDPAGPTFALRFATPWKSE